MTVQQDSALLEAELLAKDLRQKMEDVQSFMQLREMGAATNEELLGRWRSAKDSLTDLLRPRSFTSAQLIKDLEGVTSWAFQVACQLWHTGDLENSEVLALWEEWKPRMGQQSRRQFSMQLFSCGDRGRTISGDKGSMISKDALRAEFGLSPMCEKGVCTCH